MPVLSLSSRILLAMLAGIALGLILKALPAGADELKHFLIEETFVTVGQIFLRSIQLLVVPLVLVSLIVGSGSLSDLGQLGRIGAKTFLIFMATTTFAIAMAVLAAVLVEPGAGMALSASEFTPKSAPPLREVLIALMPSNPVAAMAHGDMLPLIVFALLFGIAATQSGAAGKRLLAWFEDLNVLVLQLVQILMLLAPIGVFCLVARVFATLGWQALAPLASYFVLVLVVLGVQLFVVYPLLLMLLTRLSPLPYLSKMREAQLFAFSTASSNATLPVTMRVVETLGVSRRINAFVVPLGATVNMDGTAIMQGVATVFIAQAYGIELSLAQYLMVILTALLASIGTAGVPGAGLVMLTMVLNQVGLPVAGIAMIIGVDRLLDMSRTAVNISGDALTAIIVANSEGELDVGRYREG